MNAGRHNLVIEKGATFSLLLTWKDENSNAYNLTGYTARMHIRENIADTGTILELTTENSRIALGGVAGTIQLTISSAITSAVVVNSGVYDLELISAGGVVTRLLEGEVIFSSEVTR